MSAQQGKPVATRLILYVGKGGVGKTTLAAATAARAADLGYRTLVVSTDIAHSLGDVLAHDLAGEPLEVAPLLDAQEIDVLDEARRSWGRVQEHMSEVLRREGIPSVQADELAVVPGMQEIAALVQIARKAREAAYDCIVVDAAPTGETIRLLTMPESFAWYTGKIQGWTSRLNGITRRLLRLPDLSILDVLDHLNTRIRELRALLTDTSRSSYRIVVTPDRTVLKEAQRAETYLNLFAYPVDAVIINRVMGDVAGGSEYLARLVERERRVLDEIRMAFGTLPMFQAPLTDEEPLGVPALRRLALDVFGATDPVGVLHVGRTISIEETPEGVALRIPMPNVELSKLRLTKRRDELYVDVGNFRREVPLPAALAARQPELARMREGMLEIIFERAPSHEGEDAPSASVGLT